MAIIATPSYCIGIIKMKIAAKEAAITTACFLSYKFFAEKIF